MAEEYGGILERHGIAGETAERLGAYLELMERWSRTHNLVRFRNREELVVRHVLESLAGLPFLGAERGLLVDVGSGAGLPGVPLLVVRREWEGYLIEPRRKRWAFLSTVIRELDLDAEAMECRYEDAPIGRGTADTVVSRAMGGHGELLEWAAPRLRAGGRVLLWVGGEEATRLETISGWRVVTSPLPGLERGRLASCRPCST
ncbi:MAG: 16S rRNA (guanine(527)-N(7))-methyltransferase RsmG [Acidobacteria bacterium]|nr:16S rRNA (guanine(527)-N(7))-methyltransferase RsmG [Acidobacteriota bacterium]